MSGITVIGAGAWGTGLAIVLGRKGTHQVRLWVHEKEVRESISARRVNEKFLPGEEIPRQVFVSGDLHEALQDAEILVSAMPSQHCRNLFEQMKRFLKPGTPVVSATRESKKTHFCECRRSSRR